MSKKTVLPQQLEILRSHFKVMQQCSVCHVAFDEINIRVIEHIEGVSHLLYMDCSSCAHAIIVLVSISDIGVGIMGLLSDLSYDDVCRFKIREPMDEHALLENYNIVHKISFGKYLSVESRIK
ncbi:MAG: hypothetical protein HYV41_01405 [Candidatus Magasanikbacteria bacterium]|nr:hypothetical protein [Candidatus Magasanikbacteria bacterium]